MVTGQGELQRVVLALLGTNTSQSRAQKSTDGSGLDDGYDGNELAVVNLDGRHGAIDPEIAGVNVNTAV